MTQWDLTPSELRQNRVTILTILGALVHLGFSNYLAAIALIQRPRQLFHGCFFLSV